MSYKALTIAHWFINRNKLAVENDDAEELTIMKLLKLLYYAEGCSLALTGERLFNEKIMAWEHGPVVKEVYEAYRADPRNLPLTQDDITDAESISQKDKDLLEQVFNVFGQYTASGLRNKTHAETPWREATDNGAHLDKEISRQTMQNYFKENYTSYDE